MRELTWDDFSDATGHSYAIELADRRIDVTLDLVAQLPPSGYAAHSFKLEFLGPPEPTLPQAIYRFIGTGVEPFEIFIVPIAREAGGIRYEAIFG